MTGANLCPVCLARQEDHPNGWGRCPKTKRLNLGAGDDQREGFLAIDLRPDTEAIHKPVDNLGFIDSGWCEELLALDLLEHFPRAETLAVLSEWRRVLEPKGELTLRVPNLDKLARQLLEAEAEGRAALIDNTLENIYGGHRWGERGSLDAHHWGWTPTTFERDLEAAGFVVLSNDNRHNMTVVAQR